MSIIEIISLAFALSIDTFAVSAAGGCSTAKIPPANKLAAAFNFAFCQTALTFAGWAFGENAVSIFENTVRYAAVAVLFVLGVKMCREAFSDEDEKTQNFLAPLNIKVLFMLGIATSIDALAVGVSLSFMKVDIATSLTAIAITTALVSLVGIELGRTAAKISKRLPIAGGIILITLAAIGLYDAIVK